MSESAVEVLRCKHCQGLGDHVRVGSSHVRCAGCGKTWQIDSAHAKDSIRASVVHGSSVCDAAMKAADEAAAAARQHVQGAVAAGDTTIDEIVARFRRSLER